MRNTSSELGPYAIVIVDYGMGNLRSIQAKIAMLKIDATISSDREVVLGARKLILPGVGHFGTGMKNLTERRLIAPLETKVLGEKTPVLGICLGMQLFGQRSDEGDTAGLRWLDAQAVRFQFAGDQRLRVPHVGWNTLHPTAAGSLLLQGVPADAAFYFSHSYCVTAADASIVAATTTYGADFVSMVRKGNLYGTQFHPEKSRASGLRIIENFLRDA
jgi:imidazole glycerol-phosphate synthase subunit HisH